MDKISRFVGYVAERPFLRVGVPVGLIFIIVGAILNQETAACASLCIVGSIMTVAFGYLDYRSVVEEREKKKAQAQEKAQQQDNEVQEELEKAAIVANREIDESRSPSGDAIDFMEEVLMHTTEGLESLPNSDKSR